MNVCTFLEKLGNLYDTDRKKECFTERIERYSKLLIEKEKESKRKIDFDKTIDNIVMNYPYKVYPNFTEILKNLAYFPIKKKKPAPERKMRTFIVTFKNGHTYEFTEVPFKSKGIPCLDDMKDEIEKVVVKEE